MEELVSVIIPVYNVEKYLDRCLQSVVDQTFKNLEIILVDDGSTDSSGVICDNWEKVDNRISVYHKENGGLSSARNYGLDRCHGRYITYVDSDDWLPDLAIDYLYNLIKKYDVDFAYGANIRCSKKVKYSEKNLEERILTRKQFLKKFFKDGTQENVQYAWAKIYKAELFKEVRYPEGLTMEDVPTMFNIAMRSKKIAASNRCVYYYFYNPNGITGTRFSERWFDLIEIWKIIQQQAQSDECDGWIKQQAEINYVRSKLGVLTNLALAKLTKEEKNKYKHYRKQLLRDLKKDRKIILAANIPISRKLLLCGFCVSYHAMRWMLGIYSEISKMIKVRA